ncbi:MAG TPA: YsnF/AvaK domain-containing protein [Ramlibacter sp.]|nr:YsnF/AvaK domain-containing protein [Ramlibacter sp.]
MLDKPSTGSRDGVLPVTEEQLDVGRRTVETGAVRVRKRVQEVTGQVTEPLISEFVETQRVPVGRVLQEPVGIRQEGEVTIVPVVEERLVLRKELVLVEEIRLTRRREEHNATEQVTLRRESVVIERFDPETQQWFSQGEG